MRQVPAGLAITTLILAGGFIAIGSVAPTVAGASDTVSPLLDPCALITPVDLQTTLGTAFKISDRFDQVGSRLCEYEAGEDFVVQVSTRNWELVEFQSHVSAAAKTNHGFAEIKINSVTAPSYIDMISGNFFVWKNKVVVTISIGDYQRRLSPDALEAEREKIANLALSRIN